MIISLIFSHFNSPTIMTLESRIPTVITPILFFKDQHLINAFAVDSRCKLPTNWLDSQLRTSCSKWKRKPEVYSNRYHSARGFLRVGLTSYPYRSGHVWAQVPPTRISRGNSLITFSTCSELVRKFIITK